HFRHDGETCNESLNEIPQIPAWHHFHLNYPVKVILSFFHFRGGEV
ncbi:GIY-YIG nuclease family protein, partial [Photobacterium damselae subsp. damselae]